VANKYFIDLTTKIECLAIAISHNTNKIWVKLVLSVAD